MSIYLLCYIKRIIIGVHLVIDGKTRQSIDDPLFKAGLNLYDGQFDIDLSEDEQIFQQSFKNERTSDDCILFVGLQSGTVASLGSARYEATTNSAFLIYLIA